MVDGKIPPGAAHAGHHFIGDQKNSMAAANLRHTLQISGRRYNRTQGRSADWFDNESGNFALCGLDRLLQLRCVLLTATTAAIGAVKRTAIAVRKSHVSEFLHHRTIDLTPSLVSGNRQSPQGRPVITLPTADHLMPLGLPD